MQIVINVSNNLMEYIVKGKDLSEEQNDEMALAIANGTPLPKGHGRLIDADELESRMKIGYCIVKNAPTIIEADEEVDE